MKKFFVLSIMLSISTILNGCGFHLRGAYDVPEELQTVYLQSENTHSALARELRKMLLASGIELVSQANDAPFTLYISDEYSEKRSISIDSLAAAAEFQISQAVSYEIQGQNNKTLIGPYKLIVERNFQNDINNVVGKRDEERVIRKEMHTQLALQIMRRYQSIDTSTFTTDTPNTQSQN